MTGLRSRILLIAAAIFTSLVIAALIGEAAIRYHDRNSSTVPGNLPFLYYPHKRLGYGLIHNSNHYRWAHINDQGFRGPDVTLVKRPGTLRIMAVGASTTFDTMVSGDEHTWPARLQYWLRTLAPAQPVEVINAGVPGYCTIDNLIRLQTELH